MATVFYCLSVAPTFFVQMGVPLYDLHSLQGIKKK